MQICTVEDLKKALDEKSNGAHFIDVRTLAEYQKGHIDHFVNIPLDSDPAQWNKFGKKSPIYVICLSGGRSARACELLDRLGFENLINVQGGMLTWRGKGFPVLTV